MDLCDLRNAPWIPVCDADGSIRGVGLVEVVKKAHELKRIEGDDPLQTVSLYRMLVGLTHHLLGEMEDRLEWAVKWRAGRFDPGAVEAYFHTSPWAERFGLFDPEYPFWQFPGLTNIDPKTERPRPVLVTTLIHDVASGNNKTLFSHRLDDDDIRLTPEQAARALVTTQFFALGGLNKKTTDIFGYQQSYFHAPFASGMPTFVIRDTLFETIMINALPHNLRSQELRILPLGVPPWAEERSTILDAGRCAVKGTSTPGTYLEYLLPRSRHIRLLESHDESERSGVSHLHIAQGVAWEPGVEPWFARIEQDKDGDRRPLQLDVDRAVWRESAAYLGWHTRRQERRAIPPDNLAAYNILGRAVRSTRPLGSVAQISVCALANDKAKPLTWRQERLDLPLEAMEDRSALIAIDSALDTAEQVGSVIRTAVRRFYTELFGSREGGRDSVAARKAADDSTSRTYWASVEQPFRRMLAGRSDADEFRRVCKRLAQREFARFASTTVGSNVSLFPALAKARRYLNGALRPLFEETPQSNGKEATR